MIKRIHINETAYKRIFLNQGEIPFQTFYEEMVKFISGLLNDPIGTKPSKILVDYGFDNKLLRKKLVDCDIMSRNTKIDEPHDEDGKQTSTMTLSYKLHKDNFKDKLRKMHSKLSDGVGNNS